MSSKKASDSNQKTTANPNAKSSIVHKPFATGTVNIFNPHRSKTGGKPNPPKLFLNAELEQDLDKRKAELALSSEVNPIEEEIEYQDKSWIDNLLNPWGVSAIAILLAINLVSAGFIWRNARNRVPANQEKSPVSKIGNNNFSNQEFIPLNLGTLGTIKSIKEEERDSTPGVSPIPPALAPLDNISNLSSYNTPHHYVLSTYTGEESLSLAQRKVEQVSLVNFPQGIFIYMGAFKNREDAEKFVSQLEQEDFPAHVYPLD